MILTQSSELHPGIKYHAHNDGLTCECIEKSQCYKYNDTIPRVPLEIDKKFLDFGKVSGKYQVNKFSIKTKENNHK